MKNRSSILAACCVWGLPLLLGSGQFSACAQGNLNPAGPPAPTMKSLDQLEPRIPISAPGMVLTNSGSYYLTTNLSAASLGVMILADNVSLDLNGFAIVAVSASTGPGIALSGTRNNVRISNGTIQGFGGLGIAAGASSNIRVENVRITNNSNFGIITGDQTVIAGCQVVSNNAGGISVGSACAVQDCVAVGNGGAGIVTFQNSSVIHCEVSGNTVTGISVDNYSKVLDCISSGNGGRGILINRGCSVSGCVSSANGGSGIYIYLPGCQVIGNTCSGNNSLVSTSEAGIYVDDNNNRVDGNHVHASGYAGIQVNTALANNVVVRNSVSGNGANNYINPGGANDFGPIGSAATATSPWANISH